MIIIFIRPTPGLMAMAFQNSLRPTMLVVMTTPYVNSRLNTLCVICVDVPWKALCVWCIVMVCTADHTTKCIVASETAENQMSQQVMAASSTGPGECYSKCPAKDLHDILCTDTSNDDDENIISERISHVIQGKCKV
jgi:hypothetical protein